MDFKSWLEHSRWKDSYTGDSLYPGTNRVNVNEKIKQYPNDYISYRGMPKIGVNPRPRHGATPVGIYAYPIKQALDSGWGSSMFGFANLPSTSDPMLYAFIIRPKSESKLLFIRQQNDEAYNFYQQTKTACYKQKNSENIANCLTASFRKAGYDGIVDWGTSCIHGSQGYQAVFFGEHTIQVLDMFKNPSVQQHKYHGAQNPPK